jgi:hypothetical protein
LLAVALVSLCHRRQGGSLPMIYENPGVN